MRDDVRDGRGRESIEGSSSLSQGCAGLLVGDGPQRREHRACEAGSTEDGILEYRVASRLGDGDVCSGERVGEPGNIRQLTSSAGQAALEAGLREDSAFAATGAEIEVAISGGRIGNLSLHGNEVLVRSPAGLPGDSATGCEGQAHAADGRCVRRVRGCADGRTKERGVVVREITVVTSGEVSGDAENRGGLRDKVFGGQDACGGIQLFASEAP